MLSATSSRNRSPFTPSQWQELEHQALIYKYMVSGIPIPHELIYTVKRSLESSLGSRLFPHQPVGWGCFQVGFGRKADPEPGRCRRTDGKKWRCSKEAFPYSKYCEKHMHRGRNRSRKPVELASSTANSLACTPVTSNPPPPINRNLSANTTTTNTPSLSAYSYSFSPLSSPAEPDFHIHQSSSLNNNVLDPFLYSHSSTSRLHNSTTHNLFLDSSSAYVDKDYRYYNGMKGDVDERTFFPEASSGSARNLQNSYQQGSYKCYSQSQFENLADKDTKQEEDENQHCFVLGTDFKSSATRPIKFGKESETQKPLHHFLGNQWPPKNSDSWLDLASTSRPRTSDS